MISKITKFVGSKHLTSLSRSLKHSNKLIAIQAINLKSIFAFSSYKFSDSKSPFPYEPDNKKSIPKNLKIVLDSNNILTKESLIDLVDANFLYGEKDYKAMFKVRHEEFKRTAEDPVEFMKFSKDFSEDMENLFHTFSREILQKLNYDPKIWDATLDTPKINKDSDIQYLVFNWHNHFQEILFPDPKLPPRQVTEVLNYYTQILKQKKSHKGLLLNLLENEEDVLWFMELYSEFKTAEEFKLEISQVFNLITQFFSNDLENNEDVQMLKQRLKKEVEEVKSSHGKKLLSLNTVKDVLETMVPLTVPDYKDFYERFYDDSPVDPENVEAFFQEMKNFLATKQNIFEGTMFKILDVLGIHLEMWNQSLRHYVQTDLDFFEYYHKWQLRTLKELYPPRDVDSKTKQEILAYYNDKMLEYSKRITEWSKYFQSRSEAPLLLNEKVICEIRNKFKVGLYDIYKIVEEATSDMMKRAEIQKKKQQDS